MKKLAFFIISSFSFNAGIAQQDIDSILAQVERNNKGIHANKKFWEAKQSEYKVGLSPYDPFIEYDYMWGSPSGAGNQREFSVTQRLDFPTAYSKKKELSNQQIAQASLQEMAYRQDVLLQAKLLALQCVFLNKKAAELNRRLINTENLVQNYQKKLDRGDVIILDVNKAKLQLLNLQHDDKLNENERQKVLTKISELNGGIAVAVNDTAYQATPFIPDFEVLDSTIEANDPLIKLYDLEKKVWQQQISVQKAMKLPKIEAGYHSQGILGLSYKGFHAGMSLPLWENKNKVSSARINFEYASSSAEALRLEHRMENKQAFDQLDVRAKMLREYRELLSSLNNARLLNKALELGQISIIQYFYEESFYFMAIDKYLQLEWEYYLALAKLFKYQL